MVTDVTPGSRTLADRVESLESQIRAAALRLCAVEEQLHRANTRIAVLGGETSAQPEPHDEEDF